MSGREKKLSASALKILLCATELFAEKGFDGAIMDTLADCCGVNKASIYYHFQDKQHLYEVVLIRLFSEVVDKVLDGVNHEISSINKLNAFVREFAQAAYAQSKMPALLMRELASGGKTMPIKAREQMQRLLQTLTAIVNEGVALKTFRKTDVLMLQFMIIGSLSFHITSAPMREAIPTDQPTDPNLTQAIDHVSAIVQNALRLSLQESTQ